MPTTTRRAHISLEVALRYTDKERRAEQVECYSALQCRLIRRERGC
jgi:hypothetical protein